MRKAKAEAMFDGVAVKVEVTVDERAWSSSLGRSDRLSAGLNRRRAQARLLRAIALGPVRQALRQVGLAEPDRTPEVRAAARAVEFTERGVQGHRFALGEQRWQEREPTRLTIGGD